MDVSPIKLGDLHSSAVAPPPNPPECFADRCGRVSLEAAPPCPGAPWSLQGSCTPFRFGFYVFQVLRTFPQVLCTTGILDESLTTYGGIPLLDCISRPLALNIGILAFIHISSGPFWRWSCNPGGIGCGWRERIVWKSVLFSFLPSLCAGQPQGAFLQACWNSSVSGGTL